MPLILNAPHHFQPAREDANVSLLDLVPTLLDLAGAPADGELEGSSLVGRLHGATPANEMVAGEYLAEGAVAPVVMLRKGNLKFVHSPADPDQLYDLAADPDELHNLAAAPEHSSAVASFRAAVARRWDVSLLHREVLASQKRRRLVVEALSIGEQAPWDYASDGSAGRYVRSADFWSPFKKALLRRGRSPERA